MGRGEQIDLDKSEQKSAREFAQKHWKTITAATAVGAAAIFLVRFYRQRSKIDGPENDDVEQFLEDAEKHPVEVPLLFEAIVPLLEKLPGSRALAGKLVRMLPDREEYLQLKQDLHTLSLLERK